MEKKKYLEDAVKKLDRKVNKTPKSLLILVGSFKISPFRYFDSCGRPSDERLSFLGALGLCMLRNVRQNVIISII